MTRFLSCVLSAAILFWLFGVSLVGALETVQTTITTINPGDKQIGVLLETKSRGGALAGLVADPVTMKTDGETRITMGDQNIAFSDLAVGDKVTITYAKKGKLLGKSYVAQHIEVMEHKTHGTGKILFVEPATQSIGIQLGGKTLVLCTSNVTEFKGIESLNDLQANDEVFVDYSLCADGKNTINVLQKGSN